MYCIFNGHNLDTGNYETLNIEVQPAVIKLNKYELARADGVTVTGKQYGERNITVKGRILATNQVEADDRLDVFNTYLLESEKDLDVEVSNMVRKFTATVENIKITKTGYHYEWELSFIAQPFSQNTSTTSLTFGTYTSAPTSYTNTIGGTYNAKPVLDLTVNSVYPYWSSAYLDINNAVLNQRIRITREWNWYDRVVIDSEDKTVTLYAANKTIIDDCDRDDGWTGGTITLDSTNMIEGTGCIGSSAMNASDIVWKRLNYATTIDLSSTQGTILIPVFIPTPSVGITINWVHLQIGSDATLADNYCYWNKSTQADGSAFQANAWNFVEVDLSTDPSFTAGSPDRTAVKSIEIEVWFSGANTGLVAGLLDYITLNKAGVVSTEIDYEGNFPELGIGSSTLVVADEFTSRDITITGNYTKKYL